MMNDLIACNLIDDYGNFRNKERTDFRDIDSFELTAKAKKEYENYCLIAAGLEDEEDREKALEKCPYYDKNGYIYGSANITLIINNKGLAPYKKNNAGVMRYSFSNTKGIIPKVGKNNRAGNLLKAYKLSYKNFLGV